METPSGDAELLLSTAPGVVLGARVEGGHVVEAWWTPMREDAAVGAVYLGRVRSVRRELDAAFVDIGAQRDAFLPLSEAPGHPREGQPILVQVTAGEQADKAPRLAGVVRLEGVYLVRVLGEGGRHLSRRIGARATRERLAALVETLSWPGPGAVIVRGRAASAEPAALARDAKRLAATEAEVRTRMQSAAAPARLLAPPPPIAAAILAHGVDARVIHLDDAAALAEARRVVAELLPEGTGRLVLGTGAADAFAAHGVEEAILSARESEVGIAGGGHLLVEPGATLTAIDVNSGVPETGLGREAAALAVNLAAAAEIARQVRLRRIGGLIVIDFLRLRAPGDQARVVRALTSALARDPMPTRVLPFSPLGLVEMTRKRPRGALGFAGPAGAAALLLRRLARAAVPAAGALEVAASPAVAAALAALVPGSGDGLTAALGRPVRIVAEADRADERGEVRAVSRPTRRREAS